MIYRNDIIQYIIDKFAFKKYLEIGVSNGNTFTQITCDYKVSVDPESPYPATYAMTSDEYFSLYNEKFDIIFIDGLHEYEQVYRDINNSLDRLNEGGYIVCHDMHPLWEDMQVNPKPGWVPLWTGDCWRAFVRMKQERLDLDICSLLT